MIALAPCSPPCYDARMNDQPYELPRPDLREPAFRRYEIYISKIVNEGSFICFPQYDMHIKPRTFIARFRDAILGFQRYHYDSFVIPKDANLNDLICVERSDGSVSVRQTTYVKQVTKVTDDYILTSMKKVAETKVFIEVAYASDEERDHILAFVTQHCEIDCYAKEHNGKVTLYTW
jgi:hypothetical protein